MNPESCSSRPGHGFSRPAQYDFLHRVAGDGHNPPGVRIGNQEPVAGRGDPRRFVQPADHQPGCLVPKVQCHDPVVLAVSRQYAAVHPGNVLRVLQLCVAKGP